MYELHTVSKSLAFFAAFSTNYKYSQLNTSVPLLFVYLTG